MNPAGSRSHWFCVVLVAVLTLYVLAELTPSSYALALQVFGVSPKWAILGAPREVRSDEWAIWTPCIQATVRNHFHRYNATSPYNEDLRNMNSLPILDWGLVFKPYFWPFFIVPPAYAYSFFFAFQVCCFLCGFRRLFQRLHMADGVAGAGSLLLFFCGYTQYWWTTLGPTLSMFPWVVLSLMLDHRWWKYPLVSYVATAWVLGLCYPPGIIPLCFVMVVLLSLFPGEPARRSKTSLLTAGAVAFAGLLIGCYYWDLIGVTLQTVYPGSRRSSSGTESARLLMGMVWPSFNQQRFRALGFRNICESGVVGTFLPLCVLTFVDYKSVRKLIRGELALLPRWRAAALLFALLFMTAWMVLPVPPIIGNIFLWEFVPARRMLFAVGFLLTLFCLLLLNSCEMVVSIPRVGCLLALIAAGLSLSKYLWRLPIKDTPPEEIAIFALVLAGCALVLRKRIEERRAIAYCCVLANIILFGFFNPLQSARDIFESRDSAILTSLWKMQRDDPRGWLVAGGFPGSVLNGQGFRSIQHVLISPHVQFFKERFPEMPDAEVNAVFNRYAHIRLAPVTAPYSPEADIVVVPVTRFRRD